MVVSALADCVRYKGFSVPDSRTQLNPSRCALQQARATSQTIIHCDFPLDKAVFMEQSCPAPKVLDNPFAQDSRRTVGKRCGALLSASLSAVHLPTYSTANFQSVFQKMESENLMKEEYT